MVTQSLVEAIARSDLPTAAAAIRNGADIGSTMRHAVSLGREGVITFLWAAGADFNGALIADSILLDDINDWASSSIVSDNVREAARAALSYRYQQTHPVT